MMNEAHAMIKQKKEAATEGGKETKKEDKEKKKEDEEKKREDMMKQLFDK